MCRKADVIVLCVVTISDFASGTESVSGRGEI
jgi:hypothetical protein